MATLEKDTLNTYEEPIEDTSETGDKPRDFTNLIKQIDSEWQQGWWHMRPKWDMWAERLQLYNNQRKDKDSVGDTTMFAIFQTILAAVYNDRLSASFSPREVGDDEIAENLELTAEYDYDLMDKSRIDYEWDWETAFFGRGLLCTYQFDKETMTLAPHVWHAMTVVRDPEAGSVNGDRAGRGKSRFIYREVRLTKADMEQNGNYFNLDQLQTSKVMKNNKSPLDTYMRVTAEAAGLGDIGKYMAEGENETFRIREGFTRYNGKVCFVALANDGKTVIRYQELDTPRIPIIDRTLFPIPNSWDSVSIPDLVEDKQRARAVAMNLALKGVKANLYPMYLFDKNRVDERTDFNFEFNKFIPVKGNPNGAVVPLLKDHIKQDVSYIMDLLDMSAQKATGTPDIKQGSRPESNNTATRDSLVAQGADARYSLAARIFGWSEKEFWQEWYRHLKTHMESGIDQKVVRIVGALGASWRPFDRENLIVPDDHADPDIKIDSKAITDAKRFNDAQLYRDYLQLAVAEPTAQIRSGLRHYGKLIGMKYDLIEQMFPPTIDELRAEEENLLILDGEKAIVLPEDDHYGHMQVHNKLPDSPEKLAHINAHKTALLMQKMQQQQQPPGMPGAQPQNPQAGLMPQDNLPEPAREPTAGRQLPNM